MSVAAKPAVPPLTTRPMKLRDALAHESIGRLRGPAYRHPLRGVYLAAGSGRDGLPEAADDHGLAMSVVRVALGDTAVFAGRSAAWALGARWAACEDPVEVAYPPGNRVRRREGLLVRGDLLLADETVLTGYGRTTGPGRTAFDLARRGVPGSALGWVDAVLRATSTPPTDALEILGRHGGVRGIRQARAVLAAADPRAESPRESLLRWLLLDAGLPRPTPQYEVVDQRGAFMARLDLAWPLIRVGAEYDGDQHRERDQHRRDLERHNRLRAVGWTVLQIDSAQLRAPGRLIAQLRILLARSPVHAET